jgi:hypothetical protein
MRRREFVCRHVPDVRRGDSRTGEALIRPTDARLPRRRLRLQRRPFASLTSCFRSTLRGRREGASVMDASDFEGTIVLEQLAAIGRVEDFFDAIDSDDTDRAVSLMKKANIDARSIAIVVKKMKESDGEH